MGISLAMIVKNEAASLGHCLQSVRGLVDEIVLVDTGSTDATLEIASQEGARVFHFPWVDDFAAARNESLRHCTHDWVLILDADEAIDALDHALIRDACQRDAIHAYHLTLRNYHMSGSYCIQDSVAQKNASAYLEGREYPFYVDTLGLRLCRRTPDLAFTGRIHELLHPYFKARSLPIHDLSRAVVHHFGKLDEAREKVKSRQYLDLALEEMKANPSSLQSYFNVVQQGLQALDWPVVLQAAEACMKLQAEAPPTILFGAGVALLKLGRHEEALLHFDRLLEACPGHALGLAHRGVSLAALGRGEEAERSLRQAISANPTYTFPYVSLLDLLFSQGRIEEAKAGVQQGMEHCSADPLMLHARLLFDLRINDMGQAMADAREGLERFPGEGGGLWHRLSALSAYQGGRLLEAIAILDQGLALFPANKILGRMRGDFMAEIEG